MGFSGMDELEKELKYGISNRITKGVYDALKKTTEFIVTDCKAHCRVDTGAMRESFRADLIPNVANDGDILYFTTSCGSLYDYEAHGKKPRNYVLLWEYGFESNNYGKSNMKLTKKEQRENKKARKNKQEKPNKIENFVMVINGDFMFTNAVIRGQKKLEKYLRENFAKAIKGQI